MDSFSNTKNPTTGHSQNHHPKKSNSELFASAKLVAEAAKSSFSHESDKVDKAKAAAAAEDLLNAAQSYGNLGEKGFGKYLDKAEDYLHQYHSSHSTTTTTAAGSGHSATHTTTAHPSSHSGGDENSGGGSGDYLKMAEGFFKKSGGDHNSGSGSGDYLKMAEGFLKKSGGDGKSESGSGDYMKMAQGFFK